MLELTEQKVVAGEKKWMVTMGAEWTDFDLAAVLPTSASYLSNLLQDWYASVCQQGGRDKAVMAHFMTTKANMQNNGMDWDGIVGGAAKQ
jgi:hypothetical protein